MESKKYLAMGLAPVFGFIILLSTLASVFIGKAGAEGVPPKDVLRIVAHMAENQKVISENRDAYMAFMAAKDSNVFDAGQLKARCYEIDWATLKPKKIKDCTVTFQ